MGHHFWTIFCELGSPWWIYLESVNFNEISEPGPNGVSKQDPRTPIVVFCELFTYLVSQVRDQASLKIILIISIFQAFNLEPYINPQAPGAQKTADEVVFDVSKVKESSFLKSDLTDPPSDFWCASFEKYQFKPFQLLFLITSFYIKRYLFLPN